MLRRSYGQRKLPLKRRPLNQMLIRKRPKKLKQRNRLLKKLPRPLLNPKKRSRLRRLPNLSLRRNNVRESLRLINQLK
jgi:hypothetical protein